MDETEDVVKALSTRLVGERFIQGDTLFYDRTNNAINVGNDTKGEGIIRVNNLQVDSGSIERIETHWITWAGDFTLATERVGKLVLSFDFESDSSGARYYYAVVPLWKQSRWEELAVPGSGQVKLVFNSDDGRTALTVSANLRSTSRQSQHKDATIADRFIDEKLIKKLVSPARDALRDFAT